MQLLFQRLTVVKTRYVYQDAVPHYVADFGPRYEAMSQHLEMMNEIREDFENQVEAGFDDLDAVVKDDPAFVALLDLIAGKDSNPQYHQNFNEFWSRLSPEVKTVIKARLEEEALAAEIEADNAAFELSHEQRAAGADALTGFQVAEPHLEAVLKKYEGDWNKILTAYAPEGELASMLEFSMEEFSTAMNEGLTDPKSEFQYESSLKLAQFFGDNFEVMEQIADGTATPEQVSDFEMAFGIAGMEVYTAKTKVDFEAIIEQAEGVDPLIGRAIAEKAEEWLEKFNQLPELEDMKPEDLATLEQIEAAKAQLQQMIEIFKEVDTATLNKLFSDPNFRHFYEQGDMEALRDFIEGLRQALDGETDAGKRQEIITQRLENLDEAPAQPELDGNETEDERKEFIARTDSTLKKFFKDEFKRWEEAVLAGDETKTFSAFLDQLAKDDPEGFGKNYGLKMAAVNLYNSFEWLIELWKELFGNGTPEDNGEDEDEDPEVEPTPEEAADTEAEAAGFERGRFQQWAAELETLFNDIEGAKIAEFYDAEGNYDAEAVEKYLEDKTLTKQDVELMIGKLGEELGQDGVLKLLQQGWSYETLDMLRSTNLPSGTKVEVTDTGIKFNDGEEVLFTDNTAGGVTNQAALHEAVERVIEEIARVKGLFPENKLSTEVGGLEDLPEVLFTAERAGLIPALESFLAVVQEPLTQADLAVLALHVDLFKDYSFQKEATVNYGGFVDENGEAEFYSPAGRMALWVEGMEERFTETGFEVNGTSDALSEMADYKFVSQRAFINWLSKK